jgi:predicted DNA-binding transcriptional regulator YafY
VGTDGLRWHVRAFCHIDDKYKDFIISRCSETRAAEVPRKQIPSDWLWNETTVVELMPNPRLSPSQRQVIALDFGMESEQVAITIRKAMLYYFWKRLRLDVAETSDNPSENPVVIKNKDVFEAALSEATR